MSTPFKILKTDAREKVLTQAQIFESSVYFKFPDSGVFKSKAQPKVDQLDKDADLILVEGHRQNAKGQVIIVQGRVTDDLCQPVPGVLVEIWQACESGRYNHAADPNPAPLDPDFQYWGRSVTDQNGDYRFRTILPGAYPAEEGWIRPPHIHFKVSAKGYRELTTQMYFAGQALNSQDLILQDLSPEEQKAVVVELQPSQPHPVANFEIKIKKVTRRTK